MVFSKTDFPIFQIHPQMSYLDNAATTQKPASVIKALTRYYTRDTATVYRGIYSLAEKATEQYENAREHIAQFHGAQSHELVFTKGATEGINLIASSWAAQHLKKGDEVIISELEHHANILPWIRLEQQIGIVVKYIPLAHEGMLNYEAYENMLNVRTKLVSVTHTSNVLGTKVALSRIIAGARTVGARTLVDATQAAGREKLALRNLGADFVTFSGHKILGPTGIGVLYIGEHMHDEVVPYQLGGGMVYSVDFHQYEVAQAPQKYEAGTPPIAQAIGLRAAIEYLSSHCLSTLKAHEAALCARLIAGLKQIPSVTLLGPLAQLSREGHMVSFVSSKAHAHDLAAYLSDKKLYLRAGNHCAQPLHRALGIDASLRASFSGYTTYEDIDRLIEAMNQFSL